MTDKYNSSSNQEYDPKKLTKCVMEKDGICRYKDKQSDDKTIFLSSVIIIDKEIIQNRHDIFGLLKQFESPDDILVLETPTVLPIPKDADNISVNIHHLIDFRCELLATQINVSKFLLAGYMIVLALWFYRNAHYPNTMTVLHRILSVPPVVKLFLMAGNYMTFYFCPWENANIKIYLILLKILLNLIFESILIASLFLIATGFKIARSNISMNNFIVMLS
jgi:hypothetical protein